MSLKAKHQPETELDHIRNTLTDVVGVVAETRQELKQLSKKVDANHKELCDRLDQQDAKFTARLDQQDAKFTSRLDQQDADISEIKGTLAIILSRLPAA